MAINTLDLMDEELQRASAPKTSNKPLFLFLKEGHKAVIRPLFDLKDAIVLKKHNRWSENANHRVNAVCASENEKPCAYCQQMADDKSYTPKLHFYLPVYVLGVVDDKGEKITYEEKGENGEKATKPVQGIRLLEMSASGTIGQVLKAFREFMKEEDNPPITGCDFTLTQSGSGTKKTYVLMPKMPKAMPDQFKKMLQDDKFKSENIRTKILEALPPVISEDKSDPFGNTTLQGGNAAKQAPTEDTSFDDTIQDGW